MNSKTDMNTNIYPNPQSICGTSNHISVLSIVYSDDGHTLTQSVVFHTVSLANSISE